MISVPRKKPQHVVPAWNSFSNACKKGELASFKSVSIAISPDADKYFSKIWEDFNRNKTLTYASDALAAAISCRRMDEAKEVAEFIEQRSPVGSLASLVANKLNNENVGTFDTYSSRHVIKTAKHLLSDNPRNPILWCDRSRGHLVLGQDKLAEDCMKIALNLAPNNRFILRAAARLYIHLGAFDKALHIISKSASKVTDPWLFATFITCSLLCDKTPNKIPRKLHRITTPNLIFPQSELLESIALIETYNGRHKDARQIIETTLIDPSSNALAHAEWLVRKYYPLSIPKLESLTDRSYEAATNYKFTQGAFEEAFKNAEAWWNEEPFSSRSGVHGTYIASIAGLHEGGIAFAEECLKIHSNNFNIRNNMILSLVARDRLSEANKHLIINKPEKSTLEEVCHMATRGRCLYANSQIDEGRLAYQEASLLVDDLNLKDTKDQLEVNLLFSEARYNCSVDKLRVEAQLQKYSESNIIDISTIAERGLKWLYTNQITLPPEPTKISKIELYELKNLD